MPKIDFKWLYSSKPVVEKRFPDEKNQVFSKYGTWKFRTEEILMVQAFYTLYVKRFGEELVAQKASYIKNECAKAWAEFALDRIPALIRYLNEYFDDEMEDILSRLKIRDETANEIIDLFNKYKPFASNGDYYKFAFDNLESPAYRYFYILLIEMYDYDYPTNSERAWFYGQCSKGGSCSRRSDCGKCKRNTDFERIYGKDYNFADEVNEFQKELTQKFLAVAPSCKKEIALVKLFESFQQINLSGLYEGKLSLSYNKILYNEGLPLTGTFFLSWNKVQFFDGFYIVKHPDVPFNKVNPYRIEDKNSRKAFNEISSLFLKKLPPLYVEAENGKIIKVHNQANLDSCIQTMEHRVAVPNATRKKAIDKKRIEKRELSSQDAKSFCIDLKSKFLDFLCSRHLDKYKVICMTIVR